MHKIIAQNKEHLKILIKKEINQYGYMCDLNHIDVSSIDDMSHLFEKTQFIGNISQWDVSNVVDMRSMFYKSSFNKNISNWDVSKAERINKACFIMTKNRQLFRTLPEVHKKPSVYLYLLDLIQLNYKIN